MTDRLSRRIFTGGLIGKGLEQSSECHLWRAVISQAISDAYLNEPKEREIIEMWIHTEDFITVCDLADIDYDKMKNNFLHIRIQASDCQIRGPQIKRPDRQKIVP